MPIRTTSRGRVAAAGSAALVAALLFTGCTGSPSPSATPTSSSQSGLAKSINNLIKSGIAQAGAGKTAEAVTTFNNVLLLDPTNKFAFYNLGVIAGSQNDTASALSFYAKALKTDPSYTPALFNKAIILESTDLPQAISIYQQIVRIDPKAATAFLRLSFALDKQGQTDQAKTAKAKAIALDPSLATVTPSPAP